MMKLVCREAMLVRSLETAVARSPCQRSVLGPNDLLVNISWLLVLILAMSVIMVAGQGQAINEINNVIGRWEHEGKDEILIELFQQQLIRKIDAVCAAKRKELQLDLFPDFARVSRGNGLPNDPAFQHLCSMAIQHLDEVQTLTVDLYRDALLYVEPGVDKMFDPVTFPGTSPMVNAPNVLANSDKAAGYRAFALDRIRERCLDWQEQVITLQRSAVDHFLDESSSITEVRDPDRARTIANIREKFVRQGYPMLSQAL